jgi:hypothetical protein
MPQAVKASSTALLAMPTGFNRKLSRDFPAGHSAEIIDLHDFFVAPPAKDLQSAKERIVRELPPKPDCTGMSDMEVLEAIYSWNRMRLYVYQTVLFG